jgi:hypothetical protein
LQSASDPSHTHVTFSPSFAHVHDAMTGPAGTSVGADDVGADGAGAAVDTPGTGAAADVAAVGAEAVVPDPQPARSSAPAAAMDIISVVTVLGACMGRFLPSLPRCNRRAVPNARCPPRAGQASCGQA